MVPGTPPLVPNSFIFMQFSGKNWLNNRLVPPPWKLAPPTVWEILDPPLGIYNQNPWFLVYQQLSRLTNQGSRRGIIFSIRHEVWAKKEKIFVKCIENYLSGGSKRGARDATPLSPKISSFSCSSWEKFGKHWSNSRLAHPPLGNPGSTTEHG